MTPDSVYRIIKKIALFGVSYWGYWNDFGMLLEYYGMKVCPVSVSGVNKTTHMTSTSGGNKSFCNSRQHRIVAVPTVK